MKLLDRVNIGPAYVRAALAPETFDEEARTVEVTWSTGAEVTRYDWEAGGRYIEALSMLPKHIRLERLNAGASVLDNHSAYGGVRAILGVVERAWIENGEGRAKLRFSTRPDVQDIVGDVRAGIIRHVSIGYRVHKFRDDTERDSTVKRRTAIDWEPFEVSLVTVPADAKAGVRSDPETNPCDVVRGHETTMEPDNDGTTVEETRQQPATQPDVEAAAEKARLAERARAAEIREHCRAFRLPEAEIDKLVDTGRSLGELTKQVRNLYVSLHNERTNGDVEIRSLQIGAEEITKKREALSHALSARMGVAESAKQDLGELRGRSLLDLMRFGIASKEGDRAALRLGRDEVIKRSLHSTSDFPILLQESGRRTLRAEYEKAPTTYQRFTRMGTLQDFKPTKRVQIGDAPALEEVAEGAKIKYGTMGESAEQIALATYGKGVSLTRQAIISDDLNGFARLIGAQARQVALLAENLVYAQLTGGTVGGSSIYSASSPNRLNYIEGAGALSVLTADADGIKALNRLASLMQSQTSAEGDYLNLRPRYLIVPTTLNVIAQQLVAPIQATSQKDVNVWRGQIDVIENPRLNSSAAVWYLAADPNSIDTIEVAWLEGHEGPQFDMESDFDSRGISFSCWAELAAKAIDFRGLAKSKGAA